MTGRFNRYKVDVVDSACRCVEVNGHRTRHFVAPDTQLGQLKLKQSCIGGRH